ncbi:MAG: hypothetical protein AB7K24_13285 [Gemmataceae bacterium]
MDHAIATLLTAAGKAPSGDNTQPWRFLVDERTQRIELRVDPERDHSPMNAGQRMARIAVGAALENILRTAAFNGWEASLEACTPPTLAALRIQGDGCPGEIDRHLVARASNRRVYDGTPIDLETTDTLLRHTPELDGIRTVWLCARDRLGPLADLVSHADALMFGAASLWQAILANVRFDAAATAEVREGMSLAALELSRLEQVVFKTLRRLPHGLVRGLGAIRKLARQSRRLVASASGLCLIVAPDEHSATDVQVGRALQRAWLALTAQGLAAQPMMSALVLENLARQGQSPSAGVCIAAIAKLEQDLRTQLPELGGGRLAFVLRFGHAAAPSGRTGRLPWQTRTTGLAARVAEVNHVP